MTFLGLASFCWWRHWRLGQRWPDTAQGEVYKTSYLSDRRVKASICQVYCCRTSPALLHCKSWRFSWRGPDFTFWRNPNFWLTTSQSLTMQLLAIVVALAMCTISMAFMGTTGIRLGKYSNLPGKRAHRLKLPSRRLWRPIMAFWAHSSVFGENINA